jgi:hypothetical protein
MNTPYLGGFCQIHPHRGPGAGLCCLSGAPRNRKNYPFHGVPCYVRAGWAPRRRTGPLTQQGELFGPLQMSDPTLLTMAPRIQARQGCIFFWRVYKKAKPCASHYQHVHHNFKVSSQRPPTATHPPSSCPRPGTGPPCNNQHPLHFPRRPPYGTFVKPR